MFRVEWLVEALDELAAIWLSADSEERAAITAASHAAEARLRQDALHEGESRAGLERVMFAAPLIVRFEVHPDEMVAIVLHVQLFRRRR